MTRLNRRRLPLRRFARPANSAPSSSPSSHELPAENAGSGDSTGFIESIPGASSTGAHETTAEIPSVEPTIEEDEKPIEETLPPDRLEFDCPCGANLIADLGSYDKQSRCGTCQTVLLLNLVYDPETGSHEINPFRVDPKGPL